MGFFDFIGDLEQYSEHKRPEMRMNRRHKFLIDDNIDDFQGARVLDLAAHDGRWSYAMAAAGASKVVGIEGRADLVKRFENYPDAAIRDKVELRVDDVFLGLDKAYAAEECYDVIAVFGLLYHLMDHYRLLVAIRKLDPEVIIIDSEFCLAGWPMVKLIKEDTENILNATAYYEGQKEVTKGIPSFSAMEKMAETLDYNIQWSDWNSLAEDDRHGVSDYYRSENIRRGTCVLTPK